MMRHICRFVFLIAVLSLAPFVASCGADPICDCEPIGEGEIIEVTTSNGEKVTAFTASVRFPRSEPRYDPREPSMRAITFACPNGPNPEGFVCEGNRLFEPFQQADPSRTPGFPAASADLGYEISIGGEGTWEGLSFEGLKKFDRVSSESVDPGFSGCCGGMRPRQVFTYGIELTE